MKEKLQEFKDYCKRIRYLWATSFILEWDQETMMPLGREAQENIATLTDDDLTRVISADLERGVYQLPV